MKNFSLFILLLIISTGCSILTTQPTFVRQTVGEQTVVTLLPIKTSSPISKNTVTPTETLTPSYQIIDPDNVNKLTLLHVWDVDEIYSPSINPTWISNGMAFLLPVRKEAIWGIQSYDIKYFKDDWLFETGPTKVTTNATNDIFTYYVSLNQYINNGKEHVAILDDKCPNKVADFLSFIPTSDFIVTGYAVGKDPQDENVVSYLQLWDVNKRECLGSIFDINGWLNSLDVSQDGQYLAFSAFHFLNENFYETTWLYDLGKKQILCELTGENSRFSQNGEVFVYERLTNTITQYDPKTCEPTGKLSIDNVLSNFAINPEGNLIVGGQDNITLWNIQSGEKVKNLDFQGEMISFPVLGFSQDGRFLITTTSRRTQTEKDKIMLWGVPGN